MQQTFELEPTLGKNPLLKKLRKNEVETSYWALQILNTETFRAEDQTGCQIIISSAKDLGVGGISLTELFKDEVRESLKALGCGLAPMYAGPGLRIHLQEQPAEHVVWVVHPPIFAHPYEFIFSIECDAYSRRHLKALQIKSDFILDPKDLLAVRLLSRDLENT